MHYWAFIRVYIRVSASPLKLHIERSRKAPLNIFFSNPSIWYGPGSHSLTNVAALLSAEAERIQIFRVGGQLQYSEILLILGQFTKPAPQLQEIEIRALSICVSEQERSSEGHAEVFTNDYPQLQVLNILSDCQFIAWAICHKMKHLTSLAYAFAKEQTLSSHFCHRSSATLHQSTIPRPDPAQHYSVIGQRYGNGAYSRMTDRTLPPAGAATNIFL